MDNSFYTGITTDPLRRVQEHQKGQGAKYTRSKGVRDLVFLETCLGQGNALRRERAIKSLDRTHKIKLIESESNELETFLAQRFGRNGKDQTHEGDEQGEGPQERER